MPAKSKSVLVIADNVFLEEGIIEALALKGVEAVTPDDRSKGVQIYRDRHERFGLALLELIMSRKAVTEMIRAVRSRDPQAHIVIITAYEPDRVHAWLGGEQVDEVLQMPFSVGELFALVDKYVAE